MKIHQEAFIAYVEEGTKNFTTLAEKRDAYNDLEKTKIDKKAAVEAKICGRKLPKYPI